MRWEIILDFLGGPNVITRVLARGRQDSCYQRQRRKCDDRWVGQKDIIARKGP